jgi:hypothetical protein
LGKVTNGNSTDFKYLNSQGLNPKGAIDSEPVVNLFWEFLWVISWESHDMVLLVLSLSPVKVECVSNKASLDDMTGRECMCMETIQERESEREENREDSKFGPEEKVGFVSEKVVSVCRMLSLMWKVL